MEWISTKEKLPALRERVLCLLNGEPIVLELAREVPTYEETFTAFNFWLEPYDKMPLPEWHEVTHWMPMPEPPKFKQT